MAAIMKRNYIIGILIIVFSIFFLGFYKLAQFQTNYTEAVQTGTIGSPEADVPHVTVAGHDITLWLRDGTYYGFLPSACKDAGLDVEIPEGLDPSAITWMYSETLPAVFIDTESGSAEQINTDKNIREPGHISVLEADGSNDFQLPLTYIKGRGNTSFTEFDKKPYQIKLADSAPFLGMDAAKKWIFTANASDPTLVRNALSQNLAGHLGLPQSNEGVFVDLYLNGEYAGNYYVTEKIEVRNTRLHITDLEKATEIANNTTDLSQYETAWTDTTKAKQIPEDPEDITGGYLIERDFDDRFLKEVEINESYFITDANECFILRSPEYASSAQTAYIDNYVQSVENAVLSPDGIDPVSGKYYAELIDVDSFVRKYLLEEITANYDGGVASSYFYKDISSKSDKLYAGPGWDYDVTWGSSPAYLGYVSSSPNKLSRLADHKDASVWFTALYAKPDFYEKIIACYRDEISAYLQVMADEVLPLLAETTAASAAMDRVRWDAQYIANEAEEDRETALAFLSDYIVKRKAFLDKAWIEQIPVQRAAFYMDVEIYDTIYVFRGEPLPALPDVNIDFATFLGWTLADGSTPDLSAPVYTDMTFQAILQY